MTRKNVTEEDEGKQVVDSNGDAVGVVSDVRVGTAYVDPDPGIAGRIKSKLGWDEADADDFPLDSERIDIITESEIRLRDLS